MALDESLAESHSILGHVYWNYDFDWRGTEKEFRRALELNPNEATTYIRQAFYFISVGRSEEAFRAIERYKTLDPASFPGALLPVGVIAYFGHDYEMAREQLEKVTEMAPLFPSPYYWLGAVYLEQGEKTMSIRAFKKSVDLSRRAPVALAGLGFGLARVGRTAEAETILTELLAVQSRRYLPEFYTACLFAALGRRDEAFEWLDRSYREHANGLNLLRVSPLVDDLRADPRFEELLRRLDLAPS